MPGSGAEAEAGERPRPRQDRTEILLSCALSSSAAPGSFLSISPTQHSPYARRPRRCMRQCPCFSPPPSASSSATLLSRAGSGRSSRESRLSPASRPHPTPGDLDPDNCGHRQVLENVRNQSVAGLALPFLMNWLLGEHTSTRELRHLLRDAQRHSPASGRSLIAI